MLDYELIDCGNGQKLERFGKYILSRPEPQAFWEPHLTEEEWKKRADAIFERKKGDVLSNKEDSGNWMVKENMPNSWIIDCKLQDKVLKSKLALTSFKHVGIFPEQFDNWQFIHKLLMEHDYTGPILNLFAYTGMASLAASATSNHVVHVDSVKQVVNWANENRVLSGLDPNISWVVEDAMKYIKREEKREKKYGGIILDPPAYGRGPNGEKWILEKEIFELLKTVKSIIKTQNSFLIINLYSMNITPILLENILKEANLWSSNASCFEQYIPYQNDRKLPLGICARVMF
jgi:23S rRNA (cytosine1962-C5)-methyltransferase